MKRSGIVAKPVHTLLAALLCGTLAWSVTVIAEEFSDADEFGETETTESTAPAEANPSREIRPADTVEYAGVHYVLSKSRDQVVIPPDLPEFHTVVRGDTLWGISGLYLNDNYLWPLIWDVNDHIKNPHLIYPGDKVYLPKPGPKEGTGGDGSSFMPDMSKPDDSLVAADANAALLAQAEDESSKLIRPAMTQKEMERVGYIVPERKDHAFKIIGSEYDSDFESDILQLAKPDIIYLNVGSNDDAKAGDKFYVYNYVRKVTHPVTGKHLGWLVNNFGVVQIICAFEKSSLALVQESFEPIKVGDFVAPYAEIPSPWLRDTGMTQCSLPTKRTSGYIVEARENWSSSPDNIFSAEGDIVYVDLGYNNNVGPGDYFMAYNAQPEGSLIPEVALGELIILRSSEIASTGFITKASKELLLGQPVDLVQIVRAAKSDEDTDGRSSKSKTFGFTE